MPPPSSPAPEQPSKAYQPAAVQPRIWAKWEASGAFHANPQNVLNGSKKPFCILIPPPNVTGALHLGHALNNTLQDILTRAHRMMGYETLWMPGTDHAGIATQAVVEKRLRKEGKLKGPLKSAFTREEFIAQVQTWKDEYEARITGQLKAMGCSCDFARQRFTMDDICARAVREAFFRLFKDGLIYRGKRLVNWDPALQTAVADDECYDEEVDTFFWNLRYPLVRALGTPTLRVGSERHAERGGTQTHTPITWNELARLGYPGADQHPGEQPAWVTVATTRPETYLGDTAVAVNPHDPRAKALRGLHVELPLVGRIIPIVEDSYVVLPVSLARTEEEKNDPKAAYATGFLKVTPAHDENDNQLYTRHQAVMDANSVGSGLINMMSPDGKVSDKHGWTDVGDAHLFVGLSMAEARKKVVAEFEARGLLEATKPYRQSKTFSDRSKAVIEPYLSDQWYVRVTDDRLSGAANRALVPDQRTHSASQPPSASGKQGFQAAETVFPGSKTPLAGTKAPSEAAKTPFLGTKTVFAGTKTPLTGTEIPLEAAETPSAGTGALPAAANVAHHSSENSRETDAGDGSMRFYPARYARTYEQWHDNIRDWCISRQLWWGHRIPVWHKRVAITQSNWIDELDPPLGPLPTAAQASGPFFGDLMRNAVDGLNSRFVRLATGERVDPNRMVPLEAGLEGEYDIYVCAATDEVAKAWDLELAGFTQDPDVLDTWFSSALWPLSTMGWPEPEQIWRAVLADVAGATLSDFEGGVPSATLGTTINLYQDFFAALGVASEVRIRPNSDDVQVWLEISTLSPRAEQALGVLNAAYGMLFDGAQRLVESGEESFVINTASLRSKLQARGSPMQDAPDRALTLALQVQEGMESPYGPAPDATRGLLAAFNPTSVLSTAREIITLWVSRMVMMNRYFRGLGTPTLRVGSGGSEEHHAERGGTQTPGQGPVPFRDVFIHAVVQDGEGKKMSKTAGNGVDPLDIIETHGADAMRFTLAQMATNTQDVRMPVRKDAKTGRNTSEKFDAGRNFCNKLWNASRFAISILQKGAPSASSGLDAPGAVVTQPLSSRSGLSLTDRWLLSRLGRAIRSCEAALASYEFADYAQTLYQLLWWDFCDWYLEAIKPTVEKSPEQQAVLRTGLETILRLLHPIAPFITEAIHEQLAGVGTPTLRVGSDPEHHAERGGTQDLLCTSAWPNAADFPIDEQAEKQFEDLRDLINTIRNIRSEHQVLPKRRITLHGPDAALKRLTSAAPGLIENLAGLETITSSKPTGPAVAFRAAGEELHLSNLADAAAGGGLDTGAEKERLTKLLADLRKSEAALAGRLNNPGYAQKAPPKLVEESKAQLAKIQAEIAAAESKLASL